MSSTAKEYFGVGGEYTGYTGKRHPIDGAVTREYSVKPGISIGSGVSSIRKMKRRMREY